MRAPARRIRRFFFTGLIVLAPVGVTAVILVWMFRTIDNILGEPLRAAIGLKIPGLGFVLLVVAVTLVGWAVHLAAGRELLHLWNQALARFPLTGRIYNAISQIVQAIIGERQKLFQRTVLVPYPTDGIWAVGFVTNEDAPVMSRIIGEPCVNVFIPTTPNPTSGFMLIVPRNRAKEVDITVEDAMKVIISAGTVSPGETPVLVRRGLDLESLLKDSRG
ncbi:MAG: DUF502 domain-containing protein [Gemmatimonadota bacterium]